MTALQLDVLRVVNDMRGAGYGVTIRKRLETNYSRRQSIGGLYVALDALLRKGYIERHEGVIRYPERGGRTRIYYSITGRGGRALYDRPCPQS